MVSKYLQIPTRLKNFIIFIGLWIFFATFAKAQDLHIYNWSDFIAKDTIANFEQLTHINVTYDVYDSNEVLDGRLMAGKTGYDIVVPSDNFLARQLRVDIYQPLDKTKLPNYYHLDEKFLEMMAIHDPENRYAIPYIWQSTGIGYNVKKVREILGENAPVDSWDLIFKPENLAKLKQCGVAFLDTASEMFPTVLNYLGKDPNSRKQADYDQATQFLKTLRDYVTYFHNSKYINDLSAGDICVAIGWSGDIQQAASAAKLAKNGVEIDYFVPKEGAIISFDALAIPKDAHNIKEAYTFLNYLLEPQVMANITNGIYFPSANKDALQYVKPDVRNNPIVYPDKDVINRLFIVKEQSPNIDRMMTRMWTRVLTGR